MSNKVFCEKCGAKQSYEIRIENEQHVIRGINFRCLLPNTFCEVCGNEVYVGSIHDIGIDHLWSSYQEVVSNPALGHTWDAARKEIFSAEEIAESDKRIEKLKGDF